MSVFSIEVALALLGLFLLCLEAFVPNIARRTLAGISMGGVALAFAGLLLASKSPDSLPAFVQPYLQLDTLALFYKGFALVITFLVLWLALECAPYLSGFTLGGKVSELFSLPLLVCVGMMWMASAKDLVTMFVSLELVTVSFYVLVAFARRSVLSLEAGVKYLILAALSTGFLVYGIAWVYGITGALTFDGIAHALTDPALPKLPMLLGAAFLLAGLGFKVAAAPFQMWVPDVYQGAPMPVTAFLSVGSKAAGFVVLTRVIDTFLTKGSIIAHEIQTLLFILGSITVLLGSLPAIYQSSVKRLLAYSSISHAGYLLLALACYGSARVNLSSGGIVAFYLATYLPMTVLGFLTLGLMRVNDQGEYLRDFTGLAKRSPVLGLLMTLSLASLAGLPLTAGFMGKMLVFVVLVENGCWVPLACATLGAAIGFYYLGAAIGFYYYFRPILAIYSSEVAPSAPLRLGIATKAGALVLGLAIVVLGVYPRPLQQILTPSPAAQAVAAH
jgi:NADH-quinone oxidoreductase subunit N